VPWEGSFGFVNASVYIVCSGKILNWGYRMHGFVLHRRSNVSWSFCLVFSVALIVHLFFVTFKSSIK
jgi:hypothetical protein